MNKPLPGKGDSAKRLAELRQGAAAAPAEEAPEELQAEIEDRGPCYSVMSADRHRKPMVEFRLLSGNSKARAYSYLVGADFDPSEGIVLDFSADKVTICGRNLRRLYTDLVAQRVKFVSELDELEAEAQGLPTGAVVVTKIEIAEAE